MAYRRTYDETADMTFYVDREYKVVEFFESWIDYISGVGDTFSRTQFESPYVHHRMEYADNYKINFYLTKFERDHHFNGSTRTLDYTFVHGFPISITSMPVSYDSSSLLKCTVSFTYTRYFMTNQNTSFSPANIIADQTQFEQDLAQATGGGTLSGAGTFQELNQINQGLA